MLEEERCASWLVLIFWSCLTTFFLVFLHTACTVKIVIDIALRAVIASLGYTTIM